jgi:hypothetical protein
VGDTVQDDFLRWFFHAAFFAGKLLTVRLLAGVIAAICHLGRSILRISEFVYIKPPLGKIQDQTEPAERKKHTFNHLAPFAATRRQVEAIHERRPQSN